ncbi:RNA polymerase sigma factor [Catenulispora rubra]|uniref:RNA polymerase sigma factor n=1 Tax=Catenulispora rubra TaxID=280293 RepID=UPI00189215DD|nr:SigE family RNA polymerase sigma factor [Catenulispora rubra]
MTTLTVTTVSRAKDDGPPGLTLADLYERHRLPLTHLAIALLGDRGDAEDAVHDVFVRLWHSHRGRTDMLESPLSYLRTAVVNNARSIMRRRKMARDHPPFFLPPAESAEEEALPRVHREVLIAVKELPERQREVLVLRYWADMSEADIAATTGISRGTVKSTSSRGLRSVARTLRERGQL